MDKMKKVAQGGWHPEKDRAQKSPSYQQNDNNNSRLKNFKGLQQVAGWAGYKGSLGPDSQSHGQARPLTSLQDPSAFGPPPKRDPKAPIPPPKSKLSIDDYDNIATGSGNETSTPSSPVKPRLPPRTTPGLPPRATPSYPTAGSKSPTGSFPGVTGHGLTNSTRAASSRLASAGISVPGFDIGSQAPQRDSASFPTPRQQGMSPSTVRESFAQSQTALKPLASYQKGNTVSLGEIKQAASAASSLKDKHGDQVAEGYRRAQDAGLVESPVGGAPNLLSTIAAKKKPPPPPLPNRKVPKGAPPPVPYESKPK